VRADALAIRGQADAGKEAAAGQARAVGRAVVLLERPHRGVGIAGKDTVVGPFPEQLGRVLVRIASVRVAWQVELDDVVGRAGGELGPLRVVDHVIRRSDHVGQSDLGEVVTQRLNWTDLGHERGTLISHEKAHIRHVRHRTRHIRSIRIDP
jgi:hypothetical protein